MVQNYLNLNPVSNQPKENFNLPLYNNPVRNKWYHVVLVVSPVGPNELFGAWWRVYVDGTRTNRTEMANMPLPVVRDNSYIGSSQWGLQDANSMMIVDSFRIYDQALSAQQIAALARDLNSNNPTVVPEPDLPPPAGGNGENPSGSSSSSSLGGGAIAGIVIGSVVGAAILCAAPVSVQWSQDKLVSVTQDRAYAVVGRPGTPASAAGVARRTTRRVIRRHY